MVIFGYVGASGFMELGKELTGELGKANCPMTSKKDIADSYIDDSPSGGIPEDVAKMSMETKMQVMSEKTGDDAIKKLRNTRNDKLAFQLTMNLTERKGRIQTGPDLTIDVLPNLELQNLTRRMLLSILNTFYDRRGLLVYLISCKIKMKIIDSHGNLHNANGLKHGHVRTYQVSRGENA